MESGPDTLARFDPCYTNGPVENVSLQLAFSFRYDARGEGAPWGRAAVLDLAALCREGENELLIRAYYQGTDSFQCVKSAPGLWFALRLEDGTVESGPDTLARPDPHYTNGPVENVSL